MKTLKSFIFLFYFLAAAMLIIFFYSLYIYATIKPPLEEIGQARATLAAARGKHAGKYAGGPLREAEDYFEQALQEWKKQNNTFFAFRDYSLTSELAIKSYNRSVAALDEAGKSKNRVMYSAGTRLENLGRKIDHFEKYYKNLDLKPSTIKSFNTGKTRFLEARIEFKSEEYVNALKHLLKAEENISQAEKQAHLQLVEFYSNYNVWEKNLKTAYQLSKKGQTVLLVDKLDASLTVLKSGNEFRKFRVEFGNNWMADKTRAGDKATPEGIYRVQAKKERSKTIYHKALLLDYPNKEDQKRYNQLVSSGKISKNTGIGGLIEIHGEGGKGIHWTDGCVALDNKEMDFVFSQCSINTPVIIVGASVPLEEYLN